MDLDPQMLPPTPAGSSSKAFAQPAEPPTPPSDEDHSKPLTLVRPACAHSNFSKCARCADPPAPSSEIVSAPNVTSLPVGTATSSDTISPSQEDALDEFQNRAPSSTSAVPAISSSLEAAADDIFAKSVQSAPASLTRPPPASPSARDEFPVNETEEHVVDSQATELDVASQPSQFPPPTIPESSAPTAQETSAALPPGPLSSSSSFLSSLISTTFGAPNNPNDADSDVAQNASLSTLPSEPPRSNAKRRGSDLAAAAKRGKSQEASSQPVVPTGSRTSSELTASGDASGPVPEGRSDAYGLRAVFRARRSSRSSSRSRRSTPHDPHLTPLSQSPPMTQSLLEDPSGCEAAKTDEKTDEKIERTEKKPDDHVTHHSNFRVDPAAKVSLEAGAGERGDSETTRGGAGGSAGLRPSVGTGEKDVVRGKKSNEKPNQKSGLAEAEGQRQRDPHQQHPPSTTLRKQTAISTRTPDAVSGLVRSLQNPGLQADPKQLTSATGSGRGRAASGRGRLTTLQTQRAPAGSPSLSSGPKEKEEEVVVEEAYDNTSLHE